ncbi:hypothetical protein DRO66_11995, partial [Candidatus Bathyarchaeota archaeon]
ANAIRHYCILSIGDGLVSQIPSIIIAVSAGFLISKTRSDNTVSFDLTKQLLKHTEPVAIAAAVIAAFALVPGFPKLPFLVIASGFAYYAYASKKDTKKPKAAKETEAEKDKEDKTPVEELLNVDILSILVGVRLISLVDPRKKSSVFDRIGALRRKFAQQLGIILPLVRLRDNINLEPNAYEIRLYDHVIAAGHLEPDKFLAMDSGTVENSIQGIPTKEPVYGLPALWVIAAQKENAEVSGYTVIDPESVLITHLSETLNRHAHELLTREDVQQLVDRLRKTQPSLVGEVVGELVHIGLLQLVLQNLLKEGISIRDLPLILEALGENASKTKNAALLTEIVRKKLHRTITEQHKNATNTITAVTFDPALEHHLISALNQPGEMITLSVPPEMAMELNSKIADAWKSAMDKAYDSVIILCDSRIRSAVHNMIQRTIPRLPVLAYDEIVPETNIEPIESISLTETAGLMSGQAQTIGV